MIPQDFPNGKLWMSGEPLEAAARQATWAHDPVHSVLVILTVVLIIIFIRDFFILWSPILRCLVRAKANIEMEHSVQLARTRNRAALLAALPMWLVAERFSLVSDSMWVTLGIVAGYLLLRRVVAGLVLPAKIGSENRLAVRRALYTYSIVLAAAMLLTVGVWTIFPWDEGVMRWILIGLTGATILLSTVHEGQILRMNCRAFLSFLYLCALEIVPAAALALASVFAA